MSERIQTETFYILVPRCEIYGKELSEMRNIICEKMSVA